MFYKAIRKVFLKPERTFKPKDSFGTLLQSMKNDQDLSKSVERLSSMDPMSRKIILKKIIRDMAVTEAPQEHLDAMDMLKNDDICQKVSNMKKPV